MCDSPLSILIFVGGAATGAVMLFITMLLSKVDDE